MSLPALQKPTQAIQRGSSVSRPACSSNCIPCLITFKGDDPPRDRTSALRVHGFPSRHLGSVQMTTDTALGVTKFVVADKIPLADVPYIVCFSEKRISIHREPNMITRTTRLSGSMRRSRCRCLSVSLFISVSKY
jgi:hypothetical protein